MTHLAWLTLGVCGWSGRGRLPEDRAPARRPSVRPTAAIVSADTFTWLGEPDELDELIPTTEDGARGATALLSGGARVCTAWHAPSARLAASDSFLTSLPCLAPRANRPPKMGARRRGGAPLPARGPAPSRRAQNPAPDGAPMALLTRDPTPSPHSPLPYSPAPQWMFYDRARIFAQGGEGGDGCVAFRREKGVARGGPAGGDGAKGGDVYLRCDRNLNTLRPPRVHFKAKKGTNGKGSGMHGVTGDDVYVSVPVGTVVTVEDDASLVGELLRDGDVLRVARGGRGGRGNAFFKTDQNHTPRLSEKGDLGAERWLVLELKLLADAGLIGCPNAGKSTLLAASTNAKPKIADYPFTTVVPNLGVWPKESERLQGVEGMVIADIPGLLEGAHDGVGLGRAFLRHIERCRVLIHVLSGDSPDPVGDLLAVNAELALFSPGLAAKLQIVVLNKIDLPHVREQLPELRARIEAAVGHSRIFAVSAATGERTAELMLRVRRQLDKMVADTAGTPAEMFGGTIPSNTGVELDEMARLRDFTVEGRAFDGVYRIRGEAIDRLIRRTNWDYYEARVRFQKTLSAIGITAALKEAGARDGDTVEVAGMSFEFTADDNPFAEAARQDGFVD